MNIQDKLAYIQKAIEMGAEVEVKFHSTEVENGTVAKKLISELQPMTIQFRYWNSEDNKTHWYQADDYYNKLETTIFFNKKKEEEATA